MKSVLLGIKDYCKDCWHDWLLYKLIRFYKRKLFYWQSGLCPIVGLKEGNLWHYIQQRRIANKREKK